MVEQKYTTLQEEYQKMLRKSRDSASSARDISSIDQLQELDVKFQFKTQLCREQVIYRVIHTLVNTDTRGPSKYVRINRNSY